MDDQRFDALTRALARGSSRRTALKGLFGGLIGGAALVTRLDNASAQACEIDSDCPSYANQCGTNHCTDGFCVPVSNCAQNEQCCGFDTAGAHCATCCSDDQCGGCHACIDGTCQELDCCADSDCYGQCASCVRGTCVSHCELDEYCCAYTNGCLAVGKCCTDDDCDCGLCSQGTCYSQCTDQQECCEGTNGRSYCTECCSDASCPGACEVCVEGQCGSACTQDEECCQGECVATGTCCRDSGDSCLVTGGPGTQGNCCDDLLCCASGEGGYCAECCHDSDCGECGSCAGGVCSGECSQDQECCERECVAIGTCCAKEGDYCTLGEPDPGQEPVECCSDFVCCATETSAACAECCDDTDCPSCSHCSNGICYDGCRQGEECCGAVCVPLGQCAHLCIPQSQTCAGSELECCRGLKCCIAGETSFCTECCEDSDCGACEICDSGACAPKSDCCHGEGHTCGVAAADDSAQLDCCDGLVCCDNLYYGASVCAECCVDHDCPHGGHCHEGECKYPHVCKDDGHCPKGTCCCKDGSCSGKCCHHPHPKPSDGGTVTELPVTGAGPGDERNDLLGMAALGVAATLLAAKKLREAPETQTED